MLPHSLFLKPDRRWVDAMDNGQGVSNGKYATICAIGLLLDRLKVDIEVVAN